MISYASRHCWSNSQGLLNPTEIVMHHGQRNGVLVVLDLLGKAIGEAGEPAHLHPHGQVLALDGHCLNLNGDYPLTTRNP